VLHGRLYVSAFLCHVRILPPAMACCVHPACAEQLDDLQHVFLECPVVQPAAAWVCRLFAAVAGGHPPPAHPRVLLADDLSLWRPSPNLQLLVELHGTLRSNHQDHPGPPAAGRRRLPRDG
jgi:hypothetical protein